MDSKQKASCSFKGNAPFERKGYICLYSKNTLRNYYFRNPTREESRLGYTAERYRCPKYF